MTPLTSGDRAPQGGSFWQRLSAQAIDLVLPPRCAACGIPGIWLCDICRARLKPLDGPRCFRCGRPTREPVLRCLECEGRGLGFQTAAAAFAYDGPARNLVTACKFRMLGPLSNEMAELAAPRLAQLLRAFGDEHAAQLVTWVPTTLERRRGRGFDQAELLAKGLARRAGLPAAALLLRTRSSAKQSGFDREGRSANVAAAFAVDSEAGAKISTAVKRVLLIDDVYTTGETLNQCALALGGAGYDVHAFTFARTVRGRR